MTAATRSTSRGGSTRTAHLLKPPVGNKQMFPAGGDFIVMVVGGPNQRTDFHVDPYEEFFYQVKGNMHVNVMTDDGPGTVDIREGDMWVLPRNTPHSPQRPEAGSIGLVVERVREEGTLEKFRWYCPNCNAIVHEVELQVRDIVADLPPVFDGVLRRRAGAHLRRLRHPAPGQGLTRARGCVASPCERRQPRRRSGSAWPERSDRRPHPPRAQGLAGAPVERGATAGRGCGSTPSGRR